MGDRADAGRQTVAVLSLEADQGRWFVSDAVCGENALRLFCPDDLAPACAHRRLPFAVQADLDPRVAERGIPGPFGKEWSALPLVGKGAAVSTYVEAVTVFRRLHGLLDATRSKNG